MKKLIAIGLIMTAAFTLQAQQLSGTQEYVNRSEYGGSRYSIINWSVNYRIFEEDNSFYIELSNPKVTPSTSSQYGIPGNFYSKSDLGISTWPNTDPTAYIFSLNFTIKYPDGSSHEHNAEINRKNFIDAKNKFKNTNATASSFRVTSVEKMMYNGGNDQKLNDLIAQKKVGSSNNSNNNNHINQPNINQTENSESKNTETKTTVEQIPESYKGNPMTYNKNNSSSTVDNFSKNYQQGQQITEIATGIANLLTPTPGQTERRVHKEAQQEAGRRRQLEYEAEIVQGKKDKFTKDYLPLMNIAENAKGKVNVANNFIHYSEEVENARMTLYYASFHLEQTDRVPKREEWFENAVADNNFDALMEKGSQINAVTKNNEGFPYIEKAAQLGSVDAMVRLGVYYDIVKTFHGGNPNTALVWFTKAAAKGSPNAMYHLGMIYKYGRANEEKEGYVQYDVNKDEKTAFEWFTKSIQTDYKETLFAKADHYNWEPRRTYYKKYSFIEEAAYKELAIMYRQGEVVAKDKQKAKELEKSYKENYYKRKNSWFLSDLF